MVELSVSQIVVMCGCSFVGGIILAVMLRRDTNEFIDRASDLVAVKTKKFGRSEAQKKYQTVDGIHKFVTEKERAEHRENLKDLKF